MASLRIQKGAIALVCALASSSDSLAMTSLAAPDGFGHPAVVALMLSDGYWARPFCSGMLLSNKVVLTASHCMQYALNLQGAGWQLTVTNDPTLEQDGNGWLPLNTLTTSVGFGQIVLNAAYDPKVLGGYDHDVSAIVLDGAIDLDAGAYPTLPPPGMLDSLQAARALRDASFEVLGYGILEKPVPAHGGWRGVFSTQRGIGVLGFDALDKRFIHESQRIHQDQAGACNGDSGGPSLLQVGGTNYVVGVTSSGDIPCYATNTATRTDSEEALALLLEVLAENP
jgi:Trypsin